MINCDWLLEQDCINGQYPYFASRGAILQLKIAKTVTTLKKGAPTTMTYQNTPQVPRPLEDTVVSEVCMSSPIDTVIHSTASGYCTVMRNDSPRNPILPPV